MALKKNRGSSKPKGLCKLSIDEEMTIYVIGILKQGISDELEDYDRFELDLEKVEEIDSAGIQLLLAMRSELTRRNKKLKLSKVSGAVATLLTNYGLNDHFDMGATT